MPEKAQELNERLTKMLTEMNATYPSYNPHCIAKLPHQEKIPTVLSHQQAGKKVIFTYKQQGAGVVKANLIYTTDGAHPRADWLSIPAKLQPDQKIEATLPPSATHYFINLIDENNFLVSYPDVPTPSSRKNGSKKSLSSPVDSALQVK